MKKNVTPRLLTEHYQMLKAWTDERSGRLSDTICQIIDHWLSNDHRPQTGLYETTPKMRGVKGSGSSVKVTVWVEEQSLNTFKQRFFAIFPGISLGGAIGSLVTDWCLRYGDDVYCPTPIVKYSGGGKEGRRLTFKPEGRYSVPRTASPKMVTVLRENYAIQTCAPFLDVAPFIRRGWFSDFTALNFKPTVAQLAEFATAQIDHHDHDPLPGKYLVWVAENGIDLNSESVLDEWRSIYSDVTKPEPVTGEYTASGDISEPAKPSADQTLEDSEIKDDDFEQYKDGHHRAITDFGVVIERCYYDWHIITIGIAPCQTDSEYLTPYRADWLNEIGVASHKLRDYTRYLCDHHLQNDVANFDMSGHAVEIYDEFSRESP
jgi:hypothetical protein